MRCIALWRGCFFFFLLLISVSKRPLPLFFFIFFFFGWLFACFLWRVKRVLHKELLFSESSRSYAVLWLFLIFPLHILSILLSPSRSRAAPPAGSRHEGSAGCSSAAVAKVRLGMTQHIVIVCMIVRGVRCIMCVRLHVLRLYGTWGVGRVYICMLYVCNAMSSYHVSLPHYK